MTRGALLCNAALLMAGAAAIHLSGAPQQLPRSAPIAAGLALFALAQFSLAAVLVGAPTRTVVRAAAVANTASVFIWLIAHCIGLPDGVQVWRPEGLSIPDLILPAFEAIAAVLLWRAGWTRSVQPVRGWMRNLAVVPALLLVTPLIGLGAMDAVNDAWLSPSLPLSAPAGTTITLTYCSPDGSPQAMDLSQPAATFARPVPVVLNTRSAGWFYSDRQTSGFGALFWPEGHDLNQALVDQGFAVASIDVRQVPLHPWPAPIQDAACAVRFLRAHAGELGIDPERIGAYGTSAGANLASLLGTAGPAAGFDVGEYLDQSSHVQAVVDMYGPTELNEMNDSGTFGQAVAQFALGSSTAVRDSASVINYVQPGAARFLILHGVDDALVRPHHSQDLAERLQAAGVPATLVTVQGTGHSMTTPGQQPSPADVQALCVAFFREALGPITR